MDEEDQKDIIRKVKTSGAEKDDDSLEKDVDADIDKEESKDSEEAGEGFGEEDELDEGSVDMNNELYVYEDLSESWISSGYYNFSSFSLPSSDVSNEELFSAILGSNELYDFLGVLNNYADKDGSITVSNYEDTTRQSNPDEVYSKKWSAVELKGLIKSSMKAKESEEYNEKLYENSQSDPMTVSEGNGGYLFLDKDGKIVSWMDSEVDDDSKNQIESRGKYKLKYLEDINVYGGFYSIEGQSYEKLRVVDKNTIKGMVNHLNNHFKTPGSIGDYVEMEQMYKHFKNGDKIKDLSNDLKIIYSEVYRQFTEEEFINIFEDLEETKKLYVEEDTMTINLKNMEQDVKDMLSVNVDAREKKLKGHKWADDHISTSADDTEEVADFLTNEGENKKKKSGPCWSGYERVPGTKEGDKGSCRKKTSESLMEAEYQGEKVELNKPSPCKKDCKKKFKVYVKNDKGNVVKVTFGDPNMEIRRDNPKAKKSFRARHKCSEKKDKTTAGYWSCKMWSNKKVSDIVGENLQESEKNSKFVESNIMKELILHRLHETVEPSIAPPVVKPGVKPASPKRKRIWEAKPSVKPKPKMVEDEVESFLNTIFNEVYKTTNSGVTDFYGDNPKSEMPNWSGPLKVVVGRDGLSSIEGMEDMVFDKDELFKKLEDITT